MSREIEQLVDKDYLSDLLNRGAAVSGEKGLGEVFTRTILYVMTFDEDVKTYLSEEYNIDFDTVRDRFRAWVGKGVYSFRNERIAAETIMRYRDMESPCTVVASSYVMVFLNTALIAEYSGKLSKKWVVDYILNEPLSDAAFMLSDMMSKHYKLNGEEFNVEPLNFPQLLDVSDELWRRPIHCEQLEGEDILNGAHELVDEILKLRREAWERSNGPYKSEDEAGTEGEPNRGFDGIGYGIHAHDGEDQEHQGHQGEHMEEGSYCGPSHGDYEEGTSDGRQYERGVETLEDPWLTKRYKEADIKVNNSKNLDAVTFISCMPEIMRVEQFIIKDMTRMLCFVGGEEHKPISKLIIKGYTGGLRQKAVGLYGMELGYLGYIDVSGMANDSSCHHELIAKMNKLYDHHQRVSIEHGKEAVLMLNEADAMFSVPECKPDRIRREGEWAARYLLELMDRTDVKTMVHLSEDNYNLLREVAGRGTPMEVIKLKTPDDNTIVKILKKEASVINAFMELNNLKSIEVSESVMKDCIDAAKKFASDRIIKYAITILEASMFNALYEREESVKSEQLASAIANLADIDKKLALLQCVNTLGDEEEPCTKEDQQNKKERTPSTNDSLEASIQRAIIGQEEAVKAVCAAIRRSNVGISKKGRPAASFMFVGPTGVGKTELSKEIAKHIGGRGELIRLDMTEFSEGHSVSKIIGAPPGYVGYDKGGELTKSVEANPYSVILFDEIEKAHLEVSSLLMQILDAGRLTDSRGKTVDFSKTIVVMTSNCGHGGSDIFSNSIGFSGDKDEYRKVTKDVAIQHLVKVFRPEMINRIDNIIVFNRLTSDDCLSIARLGVKDLIGRLKEIGYQNIRVNESVYKSLVSKGFSSKFGARNINRTIQTMLEDQFAEKISLKQLSPDRHIEVGIENDEVVIMQQ